MKLVKRWLSEVFKPEQAQDLDISAIASALGDQTVRTKWLESILSDLFLINMEIDRRVLKGIPEGITDLCARRKAYQDVLASVLSAKRSCTSNERHNPREKVPFVNLDRVTA